MAERELIVEVDVENGLPGTQWRIKRDPRYLLAVVYKLRSYQEFGTFVPAGDKFIAAWEDGFVELEMPLVDGDPGAFLFALTQTLESIAKILIEMEWGRKFLGAMMSQGQIKVPKPGRKLVL